MNKISSTSLLLAVPFALAACGGGSSGGGGTVTPTPTPPAPITSLREALPTTGGLSVTDSQYEASVIQGAVVTPASSTTTGGSTGLLGGLLALLLGSPTTTTTTAARLDYPFDFDEASLARATGPEAVELTLTGNRAGGGTAKQLVATFTDWTTMNSVLAGLRGSPSDSATLTGFTATEYTSMGGVEVILLDGTDTTPLSYTSFGYWLAQDVDPTDATKVQFMSTGGGSFTTNRSPDLTTIASLPASATYNGKTIGSAVVNSGIDGVNLLTGDIALTANFTSGKVDTEITNLTLHDDNGNTLAIGDITFTGSTIDSANASISGGAATTFFDATAPAGTTPDGQTEFEAAFSGPAAEEVAGTWYVSGTNLVEVPAGGTAPLVEASGAFGAAR
ncbi:MAG: hypothetical protein PHS60_10655 [Zavarzinia sp.]|nr:hypothetical protein [Zavarzinia sp.]